MPFLMFFARLDCLSDLLSSLPSSSLPPPLSPLPAQQMLVPGGRCFNLPGTVRIGYVSSTATLEHALNLLSPFLERFLAGNENTKS